MSIPTYQIISRAVPPHHQQTGRRLGARGNQSNTPMTVFSVKVVRCIHGQYHTTWYRIKTFGALAEACLTYLHQYRLVQVQGHHLSAWAFTDAVTGKPRATLELVAQSVVFLDDPNIHLAALNLLPTGDIPFSKVPEPAVDRVEAEELAVAG